MESITCLLVDLLEEVFQIVWVDERSDSCTQVSRSNIYEDQGF